jgi:hypothetical protein
VAVALQDAAAPHAQQVKSAAGDRVEQQRRNHIPGLRHHPLVGRHRRDGVSGRMPASGNTIGSLSDFSFASWLPPTTLRGLRSCFGPRLRSGVGRRLPFV